MTNAASLPAPRRLGIFAADSLLLTAALIWGVTFVAQKFATEHMGLIKVIFAWAIAASCAVSPG
jgi:hypothetical protein